MTEEQKEELGQLIDGIDNLAHALLIPMPPQFHVDCMKNSLAEKVREFKNLYQQITNENPWEE